MRLFFLIKEANMKHYETENKYPNNDVGKKQYDAAMDGSGDAGKGVHMYQTPYLWKENNVVIERDNPTENFVPTPTIGGSEEAHEKSPVKRWIKIGLLVLFVAFMIYALIAQIVENPQLFGIQESVGGFFGSGK